MKTGGTVLRNGVGTELWFLFMVYWLTDYSIHCLLISNNRHNSNFKCYFENIFCDKSICSRQRFWNCSIFKTVLFNVNILIHEEYLLIVIQIYVIFWVRLVLVLPLIRFFSNFFFVALFFCLELCLPNAMY